MYKCKYCGKEFNKALSLGGHITKCLLNPNRVTNKGKKVDQSYNNVIRDDLFCQYCGKKLKTLNSLKNHECRCKENPNKPICWNPENTNNRSGAEGNDCVECTTDEHCEEDKECKNNICVPKGREECLDAKKPRWNAKLGACANGGTADVCCTYCYDSDDNWVNPNTLPYQEGVYVDNITLQASNFKRDGYGFAGWNDKADMTGTNYGPNQTIPVTQDMIDNGFTLYAHWVESTGNLQGWNGCSTLSTNQVIGLTDTRDNNVYAVSKLADGNCWMIENLRLADTDSNNSPITLNSTNTNNPASTFTALSATSNEWCTELNEACINQNKLNTSNTISFTTFLTACFIQ